MAISYKNQDQFAKNLIIWQLKHGRHNLPWQRRHDAYHVWVSEIMLQQTQVSTVINYYQPFITRFPSIQHLAEAPEDAVLHLWSGLGYYRRAKNLHKTAQQVVSQHNGQFPTDLDQLMALPGIGRSTAGAIRSLAFKIPTPILDGNVKRVIKRYFNLQLDPKQDDKTLWPIVEDLVPEMNAHIYTQAQMDLGAMVCIKKEPKCHLCPLKETCQYTHHDITPQKRSPIKEEHFIFLVIQDKNSVWLTRRPEHGIWANLYTFPMFKDYAAMSTWLAQFSKNIVPSKGEQYKHRLTHRALTLSTFLCDGSDLPELTQMQGVWYNNHNFGLPKPVSDIIQKVIHDPTQSTLF